ncbi:TlpA disulfide reductase family protein [Salinibacterium sp. ZJ450]|uniref:TlpA family protein disulfide reductase n=1 Tax=Salinibacterium sp. ZJ450 TaxID=2708338 RepID=UPI001CD5EB30|nr:TlpA disulfide reductase family protein [Salinibacterium sp. ZJ450]
MRARGPVSILLSALLILAVAGCTDDPLAQQYREGTDKGYVAGDGNIITTPLAERGDPIVFDSELSDGSQISSDEYGGKVLVVNFWYASCAPCREEAPDLEELNQEFADDVSFLGVNLRDSAGTAEAFMRKFEMTFPTVLDVDNGTMTLAFAGVTAPRATPSTIVLDQEGRVSAQIMGMFDRSILRTLIAETIAEPTEAP